MEIIDAFPIDLDPNTVTANLKTTDLQSIAELTEHIQAQLPLFALLGEGPAAIGVRLTESLLMTPGKTVSGIFFPSASTFFSCRLCPRERCEGRTARYDETAAREYGILK